MAESHPLQPTVTEDTFFKGRLRVMQHKRGYRFSIDAVLLAHYTPPRFGERVLDLGTGCGIIPLIMAFRQPQRTIIGVEIQTELYQIARKNVTANNFEKTISILQLDFKGMHPAITNGDMDTVVSNPPFRQTGSGRVCPNRQRAVARHEIKATLEDLVHTSHTMLRRGGWFRTIYPATRLTDLLVAMRSAGIEPKHLRSVYPGIDQGANLVLVGGVKGGRKGMKTAPPLVVYGSDGHYSPEVAKMFLP